MAGLSLIAFVVLMVPLMALWVLVQATPQPEQIHISNTGQLCQNKMVRVGYSDSSPLLALLESLDWVRNVE